MRVAVVGATGMVGNVMLDELRERQFPVSELIPVASEKSVGNQVIYNAKPSYQGKPVVVYHIHSDHAWFYQEHYAKSHAPLLPQLKDGVALVREMKPRLRTRKDEDDLVPFEDMEELIPDVEARKFVIQSFVQQAEEGRHESTGVS